MKVKFVLYFNIIYSLALGGLFLYFQKSSLGFSLILSMLFFLCFQEIWRHPKK